MRRKLKAPMRGDAPVREYSRDVFRATLAGMTYMKDERGGIHKAGAGDVILIVPKAFAVYPITVEFADGQAAKVEAP